MIDKILELLPIIGCQRATELLSQRLERPLSLKEKVDLKLHLHFCDLCVNFGKQLFILRSILRQYIPLGERRLSENSKTMMKNRIATQSGP